MFEIPEGHFDSISILPGMGTVQKRAAPYFIEKNLCYCPVCLEKHAFHSLLHQIRGIETCPWHPKQKIVRSDNLKFAITGTDKYAYSSKSIDGIRQHFPADTPPLPEISQVKIPYKKIFTFFSPTAKEDLHLPILETGDDLKTIAETEEEIKMGFNSEVESLSREFYSLTYNEMSLPFNISWEEYHETFFVKQGNYFLVRVFIHIWILHILSDFPQNEVREYMSKMDEWHGNLDPDRLPNSMLVSAIRCSRAVLHVRLFREVLSNSSIFHPHSTLYEPVKTGISFETDYLIGDIFEIIIRRCPEFA